MSTSKSAPGALELVRGFVNTLDPDDGEALVGPPELAAWLREHDLLATDAPVTRGDLTRAIELREALRGCLLAHNGAPLPPHAVSVLDACAQRGGLALRFPEAGGARVEPTASGCAGALGRLLVAVADAMADGTWVRLKACRDETCEWAFYDRSKNRSGTWCSMAVCGNRKKVRAFRERRGD